MSQPARPPAGPELDVALERAKGEISDVLLNVEHALDRARPARKVVMKYAVDCDAELAIGEAIDGLEKLRKRLLARTPISPAGRQVPSALPGTGRGSAGQADPAGGDGRGRARTGEAGSMASGPFSPVVGTWFAVGPGVDSVRIRVDERGHRALEGLDSDRWVLLPTRRSAASQPASASSSTPRSDP